MFEDDLIPMILRLIFIFILMASSIIHASGQLDTWKDIYRSYTINVELKDDEVLFEYELYFNTDSEKGSYKTSSLDTFILLLKKDMATFPEGKENVLFYFHGMFGGQILNYKSTLVDFKLRYIDPQVSDMSRVIGYRWPGNSLDYPKCKQNAHAIAEAMNSHFNALVRMIEQEASLTSVNVLTHSLGSELFKEMMSYEIQRSSTEQINLKEVIICAPDLDVTVFHEAEPLSMANKLWDRVTVYHSNKDFTLTMSKNFNNKNRLGLDGPDNETVFDPKLYFVETSKIADEENFAWRMTGHSYVRASNRCSADMLQTWLGTPSSDISNREAKSDVQNSYLLQPVADQNP